MSKNELIDFIRENKSQNVINLTLTEKQKVKGRKIDDILSSQNFRHFKNLLNTKIYGKSYRRFGVELKMFVVREVSHIGRHHLHCIVELPKGWDENEFFILIQRLWLKTNFGYRQSHFEKPSNEQRKIGWLLYILKDSTKVNGLENSIDWCNCTL